ncbi:hypothetical protein [Marisediminicola senii]|uniref:hypothetical protein n=1 Tax=Marisediminicola senii TaxID=2711233 RepID=UPI0013EB31A5|nr:hypothetical protein [Marisediminicola senii]
MTAVNVLVGHRYQLSFVGVGHLTDKMPTDPVAAATIPQAVVQIQVNSDPDTGVTITGSFCDEHAINMLIDVIARLSRVVNEQEC